MKPITLARISHHPSTAEPLGRAPCRLRFAIRLRWPSQGNPTLDFPLTGETVHRTVSLLRFAHAPWLRLATMRGKKCGLIVPGLPAIVTCSAAAATSQPAVASSPPVDSGNVLQVLLGLVIVLLVIGGVAWLLRHVLRFQPTMSGQLRILGGLSMGPRERVVLLKVGETQLLLSVAPGRVHTLHVLEKPLEASGSDEAPSGSFAEQLGRAVKRAKGARSGA